MPYTQNQMRCLSGMGLVPWIERAKVLPVTQPLPAAEPLLAGEALAAAEPLSVSAELSVAQTVTRTDTPAQSPPDDLMHTPLIAIPFRGQYCTQLGKADAALLILVEAVSSQQKQYPFESTDAKLFDDMLRAIAWRRQDVCLGVLAPALQTDLVSADNTACVADLCKPHRDAVLLFRHVLPETLDANELMVPMQRASMRAWQLPHPALLRESPTRKRQAWNVLKAARACLQ